MVIIKISLNYFLQYIYIDIYRMDTLCKYHDEKCQKIDFEEDDGKVIVKNIYDYDLNTTEYMPKFFYAIKELKDEINFLKNKIKVLETNVLSVNNVPPPPDEHTSRTKKPINIKF
jgi:hypothetical protein